MRCLKCGTENQPNYKFCVKCGATLGQPAQNYSQPQRQSSQQPTYDQSQSQGYQQPQKGMGFAITSMVCGIVGLVLFCIPYLPIVLGIIGLVFGIISLVQRRAGKGMAIAGVVCSGVALIPAIFVIVAAASYESILQSIF